MSAQILYGKPCADKIGEEISKLIDTSKHNKLYTIGFKNNTWVQYTSSLVKSGARYGIECENIVVDTSITPKLFFDIVARTCAMPDARGVILQQPLDKEYRDAVKYIDPAKDVDCLNPLSIAELYNGAKGFRPATPTAVLCLLDYYGISLEGKNVVIIGRGNAVGKPLSLMALARNATVTVCHTKTVNLSDVCKRADILVSACGVGGLVRKDFVTSESIVIDVGLSFSNGVSRGDAAEEVYEICKAYSPVPGGVGPVTRAALFFNMLQNGK